MEIYNNDPRVKKPMSLAECTIHVLGKDSPVRELLDHVDHMSVRDVTNAHPGLINLFIVNHEFLLKKLFMRTIRQKMVGSGCCNLSRTALH